MLEIYPPKQLTFQRGLQGHGTVRTPSATAWTHIRSSSRGPQAPELGFCELCRYSLARKNSLSFQKYKVPIGFRSGLVDIGLRVPALLFRLNVMQIRRNGMRRALELSGSLLHIGLCFSADGTTTWPYQITSVVAWLRGVRRESPPTSPQRWRNCHPGSRWLARLAGSFRPHLTKLKLSQIDHIAQNMSTTICLKLSK